MRLHGSLRDRIAQTLNAAYGDGLLSEGTLSHRLDMLCAGGIVEPEALLGDLSLRRAPRVLSRLADRVRSVVARTRVGQGGDVALLALDWEGGTDELVVGRAPGCDIVLGDLTVSRRHVRLRFRDGRWILQDLESTNGTFVNGRMVGRCALAPGDAVALGDVRLVVD